LRRLRSRRDAEESAATPLDMALAEDPELNDLLQASPEQRKAKAAGQPWLTPQELDKAGFEETLPSGSAELEALADEAEPAPQPAPLAEDEQPDLPEAGDRPSPEQILLGLREGSWVDLYSKRHWLRAQLIWASTRGTLFMFVSHGGQPHSMTKRSCERLLKEGLLRPVATHGVVAQALNSLVREVAPVDAKVAA
jgi:hypothetical protein